MNGDVKWSLTFRYIAGLLLLAAVIAFLVYARDVVRTLAIAAFVAYLINPAVVYLSTRTRMSRTAAVNYVYFSALILLIAIPAILAPIFYDEAEIILRDLLGISNQLRQLLSSPIRLAGFVFHLEEWGASLFQLQNAFLAPLPEEALQILETTSVGFLWFLVVLVSIHFFLAQWPTMRENLIAFAPQSYRPELHELYTRVRRVWMAYLRGQIVLMIIVGVVFTVAWVVMGIPGALVLGVVAGLFTLVPDVGPFLAAVLAAGVALLEGSTWIPLPNFMVAGIVVLVYLVLIGLKNFFLRPYIMGRSVHMNEALVFIIIVVATVLEGILGALLIVPLYATTVVILGYLQRKLQGLPPFEDDGSRQFVMPENQISPPGRKWGRRATDRLEGVPSPAADPAQATMESAALLENASSPEWGRRATDRVQDTPVADPPAPALEDDSSGRETESKDTIEMKVTYSIIAPIYNEKENLPELYRRIREVMDSTGEPWELLLVDDGSSDGSTDGIHALEKEDKRVRPVIFARNFGHQVAVTAGLDYSRGDAVVIIDADLQDPPELILEMAKKWREGYEVVYAVRAEREGESWFKLWTASLFYRIIYRITDVKIPLDTGDFRLMDRRVVNVINKMRERHRFLRGMSAWVGFRQIGVEYKRAARTAGETKYPFRKMFRLAINAITGFSYFPLQVATYFGFICAGIAAIAIPIVIYMRVTGSQAFFGQATTLIAVLFLGGVQLICVGILGEYIGRLYDEAKGRPLYIVREAPEDLVNAPAD